MLKRVQHDKDKILDISNFKMTSKYFQAIFLNIGFCFLVLAGCFVLAGQPAAALEFSEGDLVKATGEPAIYIISQQQKVWIPSVDVFNGCGYDWTKVNSVSSLVEIPVATLIKKADSPDVYYLEKNLKRPLASVAVFESYGFDWQKIVVVCPAILEGYAAVRFLQGANSPDIYRASSNFIKQCYLSWSAFIQDGGQADEVLTVSQTELDSYAQGVAIGENQEPSTGLAAPTLTDPGLALRPAAEFTLEWSDVSTTKDYRLDKATNSSFTGAAEIYRGTATSSLQVFTSANQETSYYRVRACDEEECSAYSNVVDMALALLVPQNYSKIQLAIEAAKAGNVILVADGTYTEDLEINQANLTIKSVNGPAAALINSQAVPKGGMTLRIKANNITLDGFTFTGGGTYSQLGYDNYGIMIDWRVSGALIQNCLFRNWVYAVYLQATANNNLISANTIENTDYGIWNYGSDNTFSKNTIKTLGWGIYLGSSDLAGEPTSQSNTIKNNRVLAGQGLGLQKSEQNLITENMVENCTYGINIGGAATSNQNRIYRNQFANNNSNVFVTPGSSANTWQSPSSVRYLYLGKTYTSYLGNYWGNYQGQDGDANGVAETGHSFSNGQDNYPLIQPISNYQ